MKLSTAQYSALRRLHDYGPGEAQLPRGTVNKLYYWLGLIESHPLGYELTDRGEAFVHDYVARTGDGPEDLKAMFRFR